jgi:predicted methyltransferase
MLRKLPCHLALTVGLLLLAPVIATAQDNVADAERLIDVLRLKPGSIVGELGAGGGALTLAIARHVGPAGRVFATELGASRVHDLQRVVQKSGLTNVEIVEGHETRTNLAEACCDAVFMRNVYHHFGDPVAMNASAYQALKPGGRIAIIDFHARGRPESAPPGRRAERQSHGVSPATVADELRAAGFEVISSDDGPDRGFLVVAAKPGG